jgi:uncharacterized protein YcaQ
LTLKRPIPVSQGQARALALHAQGLLSPAANASFAGILANLGCIQIDSIAVTGFRSHELVLCARGLPARDAACVLEPTSPPQAFEYFGHAISVLPAAMWPFFGFRRRAIATRGWRGPQVDLSLCDAVRELAEQAGGVTTTELGGKGGGGWAGPSDARVAADWLVATGTLVCVTRRAWRRVYQPASVLGPGVLAQDPSDQDCLTFLVQRSLRSIGTGTAADIADYFRLHEAQVHPVLNTLPGLREISVDGWQEPAWAFEDDLDALPRLTGAVETWIPLSPFDSLIWTRPRMRRLFGVEYLLEAYKPAAQRTCGYFGMPILSPGGVVGRVAVRRRNGNLIIEGTELALDGQESDITKTLETLESWCEQKPPGRQARVNNATA